jgi:hypothetical protein
VPPSFVALIVTLNVPFIYGDPEIIPVVLSIVTLDIKPVALKMKGLFTAVI